MCRRFVVSGRVQGVAYRASAVDAATRLGVAGWVRNLANGDVEVLACGDAGQLAALEKWLWQGPRAAKVSSVAVSDVPSESFDTFEIRY